MTWRSVCKLSFPGAYSRKVKVKWADLGRAKATHYASEPVQAHRFMRSGQMALYHGISAGQSVFFCECVNWLHLPGPKNNALWEWKRPTTGGLGAWAHGLRNQLQVLKLCKMPVIGVQKTTRQLFLGKKNQVLYLVTCCGKGTRALTFENVWRYMFVCLYVSYVSMHACMYVCINLCMYACMYVCMYECINAFVYTYDVYK